jgi:methylphosphotriester-DNA--protein-cysteine methyltransferase
MAYVTEAARWRALTSRDRNANGEFVYSVKSTNIYCRPTCPARLARRANVGFFKTPAEAEAAGFRACKRCKPQEVHHEDPQELAVGKACKLIEDALKQDNPKSFRLQDLAKNVGLTPRYFHKIFKDKTGLTPKEYAKAKMAEKTGVDITPSTEEWQGMFDAAAVDLNHATFDFNELMDFDFDTNLTLDNTYNTSPSEQALSTPTMLGQEIDVNIQPEPWNLDPNATIPGLDLTNGKPLPSIPDLNFSDDKQFEQFSADAISRTLGWQPYPSITAPVSTFEMDAALILSSDNTSELLPGVKVGT